MEETPGKRLGTWIDERYKSRSEFARCAKISPGQLGDYTSDRKRPGYDIIARWVELGLDANWFLTGKFPSTEPESGSVIIRRAIEVMDQVATLLESESQIPRMWRASDIVQMHAFARSTMTDEEKAEHEQREIERERVENSKATKN